MNVIPFVSNEKIGANRLSHNCLKAVIPDIISPRGEMISGQEVKLLRNPG
jgi:hypothetical protein